VSATRAGGAGPLALDDEHAPIFTVGQVAEILGVPPGVVRRLDTEPVVSPRPSAGGQRRYTRHEIGMVQAVWTMAGEGMTLPGIRRILALQAEVAALREQVAHLQAELEEG
jgi:DNA-binding transcriptional MerR regulator